MSSYLDAEEIIKKLRSMANPKNVEGMARFGINPQNTLGISLYDLRPKAKSIPKSHKLAIENNIIINHFIF